MACPVLQPTMSKINDCPSPKQNISVSKSEKGLILSFKNIAKDHDLSTVLTPQSEKKSVILTPSTEIYFTNNSLKKTNPSNGPEFSPTKEENQTKQKLKRVKKTLKKLNIVLQSLGDVNKELKLPLYDSLLETSLDCGVHYLKFYQNYKSFQDLKKRVKSQYNNFSKNQQQSEFKEFWTNYFLKFQTKKFNQIVLKFVSSPNELKFFPYFENIRDDTGEDVKFYTPLYWDSKFYFINGYCPAEFGRYDFYVDFCVNQFQEFSQKQYDICEITDSQIDIRKVNNEDLFQRFTQVIDEKEVYPSTNKKCSYNSSTNNPNAC